MTFPLRLSRAFFEKNLEGTIEVTADQTEVVRSEAAVSWKELPPTSPAPEGEYLADFRDHQGCAGYQDSYGVNLCFTVTPDLSSVDLTADKLQLKGAEALLQERDDCEEVPTLHFMDAKKEGTQTVTVTYRAEYPSCPAAQMTLVLRAAA